jgi:hypothetical protein
MRNIMLWKPPCFFGGHRFRNENDHFPNDRSFEKHCARSSGKHVFRVEHNGGFTTNLVFFTRGCLSLLLLRVPVHLFYFPQFLKHDGEA